jgi:uncharacterized membrane protein
MPRGVGGDIDNGRAGSALAVVTCAFTVILGYLNKARCAGAPFDPAGRSRIFDVAKDSSVCYSDIQYLWLGRDINHHVFPYVDGSITPHGTLVGGTVEYPVLSGALMWLGALGARDDAAFLRDSALLLGPFALLTAWLLGRMAGRAALLWSASPPLVLYAFHNWELPAVATSAAACWVMRCGPWLSLRVRGVLAAVLLGIGFCLKLYPGVFVAPLLVYVATGGADGAPHAGPRAGWDGRGAALVGAAALATVAALNLPFALSGYRGWAASFTFQQQRQADITTNSLWYWGLRPAFDHTRTGAAAFRSLVGYGSPALVLASFALAMWLGSRVYRRTGTFPWIGVSGAMLCGLLVLHKVRSPQYTLWLLPFLVLLAVPWRAVAAYLVVDLALGIGDFRYFYALGVDHGVTLAEAIVRAGVWAGAALSVYFFIVFVRAPLRCAPPRPAAAPPTVLGGAAMMAD